jgi:hypothetical protein
MRRARLTVVFRIYRICSSGNMKVLGTVGEQLKRAGHWEWAVSGPWRLDRRKDRVLFFRGRMASHLAIESANPGAISGRLMLDVAANADWDASPTCW